MKSDIGSESRFLPTSPAFDATVMTSPSEYCHDVCGKKLEWCGYPMVKKFWRYIYSFRQNTRTWQTDRRTDTAWQHWPRLHSIARQKPLGFRVFAPYPPPVALALDPAGLQTRPRVLFFVRTVYGENIWNVRIDVVVLL